MTNKPWTVEHEISAGENVFQVRRYAWPTPNETVLYETRPVLGWLMGSRLDGESRPRHAGSRTGFRKLGPLTLTPPDTLIDVRGQGGKAKVAAFEFASVDFERHSGGLNWDDTRLSSCADIFGTRIEPLMAHLAHEAKTPGFASDVILQSTSALIAVELARFFRAHPNKPSQNGQLTPAQLSLIAELIEEAPTIVLQDIAKACGLSVRTLTRRYKASTGQTIGDAIANSRIHRAKSLLKDGALSIKIIAYRTGFSHVGNFTAAFRRAVGVTPRAFRNDTSV